MATSSRAIGCNMQAMRRWGAGAVIVWIVSASCGCGSNSPTGDDQWPHIFDTNYGLQVAVAPPSIVVGVTTSIQLSARSNYSGTGYFTLEGGDGYGSMVSPLVAPFGRINCRANFVKGQQADMEWILEFTDGPNPTLVSAIAWMDSLDIGGVRYPISSPEVAAYIGVDFGHQLYRRLAIPR